MVQGVNACIKIKKIKGKVMELTNKNLKKKTILLDIFDLKGRVIVITGASGLLGRKHAEAVSCYGGIPVLLDLSQKSVDDLANDLNAKYNAGAIGFSVDITNESMIERNANLLIDKFGKIDGLVNNAANNPKIEGSSDINFSRLENFPLDLWNNDLNVGLTGSFLCAKHYGYKISQNPNGGSIVNISSDLGLIAPDQRLYKKDGINDNLQNVKPVTYSIVKTGLIGLTRYLATYWADKNVRCNAMCPGGVENGQPNDFLEKVNKRIPMGRMANADEYQGTLLWMLSDASSYLNGSIISVDGGRTTW
jgi:NAD(P)-dependent dehydrogenase (short-subunit alcohol dehydrogenase family)